MNRKARSSRLSRRTAVTSAATQSSSTRARDIRQYYSSQNPGSSSGGRSPLPGSNNVAQSVTNSKSDSESPQIIDSSGDDDAIPGRLPFTALVSAKNQTLNAGGRVLIEDAVTETDLDSDACITVVDSDVSDDAVSLSRSSRSRTNQRSLPRSISNTNSSSRTNSRSRTISESGNNTTETLVLNSPGPLFDDDIMSDSSNESIIFGPPTAAVSLVEQSNDRMERNNNIQTIAGRRDEFNIENIIERTDTADLVVDTARTDSDSQINTQPFEPERNHGLSQSVASNIQTELCRTDSVLRTDPVATFPRREPINSVGNDQSKSLSRTGAEESDINSRRKVLLNTQRDCVTSTIGNTSGSLVPVSRTNSYGNSDVAVTDTSGASTSSSDAHVARVPSTRGALVPSASLSDTGTIVPSTSTSSRTSASSTGTPVSISPAVPSTSTTTLLTSNANLDFDNSPSSSSNDEARTGISALSNESSTNARPNNSSDRLNVDNTSADHTYRHHDVTSGLRPRSDVSDEMESDSVTVENASDPVAGPSPALNQSVMDFQPRKIIKASTVAARFEKKSPVKPEKLDEESGDEGCPICFDMWTTSGKHRIVSLKCGHLFGLGCIQKWLKGQGQKCPQCNIPAKVSDIRLIYAKVLKAVDTTEVDRLRIDLEKEREQRRRLEMETAELRLMHRLAADQCKRQQVDIDTYKQQISSLRHGNGVDTTNQSSDINKSVEMTGARSEQSFMLEKSITVTEAGGCRVSACSSHQGVLVVSQPSPNQLFPGFGVKKLSCMDWRTSQYLSIHSKPIRDLAFHDQAPSNLLSAGMDKTLKLTSLNSNVVILSFSTPAAVWSCSWGESCHQAIAGLVNGQTIIYDTRKPDEPVHLLNTGARSPVAALQYVPKDLNATFRPGGLLVGQLDRCSFHEFRLESDPKFHLLPLDGSLCSMSFERHTRHLLASFRPSSAFNHTRHELCEMVSSDVSTDPTNLDRICMTNSIHTFNGGGRMSQLSRSTLFEHPGHQGKLIVCAGDEASLSTKLWDGSEGRPLQRLRSDQPVLDTEAFIFNNDHYLTTLTEKTLSIYKWS